MIQAPDRGNPWFDTSVSNLVYALAMTVAHRSASYHLVPRLTVVVVRRYADFKNPNLYITTAWAKIDRRRQNDAA